jgi:hypothetical protein
MRQDLEQAHHGQFLGVPPGFDARFLHLLAADTDKAGLRVARPQLFDQGCAQLVAGWPEAGTDAVP